MFTLDVCVCVNVGVSAKVEHCINGNANAHAEIGSELILYVNVCVAIDTMLNFDGGTNTDVKREQALRK